MAQETVSGNGVISPSQYRHPKEQLYFIVAAIVGGLVWAGILLLAFKSAIV